jgi:hypothetical protein
LTERREWSTPTRNRRIRASYMLKSKFTYANIDCNLSLCSSTRYAFAGMVEASGDEAKLSELQGNKYH